MIYAALLLAAALQGPDLDLEASSRKREGAFELRFAGKGPALRGHDLVGLRFHRRVNRADWNDRSISTAPLAEPWGRCAHVREGAFVHRERFRAPAEVEVRVILDGKGPDFLRIVRVGAGADVALHLARNVRKASEALASLRELGPETASLLERKRGSKRRARSLIDSLERRRIGMKEEEETTLLTASVGALLEVVADLQQAAEVVGSGKRGGEMRLTLSGEIVSSGAIKACLDGIEEILARERDLVLVQAISAVCDEIASAPPAGRGASRTRRRLESSVRTLARAAGSFGDSEVRTAAGSTPADLVAGVEEYLNITMNAAVCPGLGEPGLNGRHCWLFDQIGELEERLRTGP